MQLEHLQPLLLFLPLPYRRVGGVGVVDDAEVVAPVIAVIVVAKINISVMKKNKEQKKNIHVAREPLLLLLLLFLPSPFRPVGGVGVDGGVVVVPVIAVGC